MPQLAKHPHFKELAHLGLPDDRDLKWYSGYPISNDRGYPAVIKELGGLNRDGGIAVYIGAGGTLSMLPELGTDIVVSADIDPSVIAFNQLLTFLISRSNTPNQVMRSLEKAKRSPRNLVARMEQKVSFGPDVSWAFKREVNMYGEYHWTNPERYQRVKELVGQVPWLRLVADVSDPRFSEYLGQLAETLGQGVTLVNLTNVHNYVVRADLSFLQTWPLEDEPLILYSRSDRRHGLQMRAARSPEEYIEDIAGRKRNRHARTLTGSNT